MTHQFSLEHKAMLPLPVVEKPNRIDYRNPQDESDWANAWLAYNKWITPPSKIPVSDVSNWVDKQEYQIYVDFVIDESKCNKANSGCCGFENNHCECWVAIPLPQREGDNCVTRDYLASDKSLSEVPCVTHLYGNKSIELLTALLNGKTLIRGEEFREQRLWCEWFKEKPYFYVNGWGSAFGNAMDRVIGIIETNGAEWSIELPDAQASVASKDDSSNDDHNKK